MVAKCEAQRQSAEMTPAKQQQGTSGATTPSWNSIAKNVEPQISTVSA
jgi:hypothetical protein